MTKHRGVGFVVAVTMSTTIANSSPRARNKVNRVVAQGKDVDLVVLQVLVVLQMESPMGHHLSLLRDLERRDAKPEQQLSKWQSARIMLVLVRHVRELKDIQR